MTTTTKNDALLLPEQLAAELAALDLTTFEQRRDAVNGAAGVKAIRARYMTRLTELRRTFDLSDALCTPIATAINRQCDSYLIAAMDGERFRTFPKTV